MNKKLSFLAVSVSLAFGLAAPAAFARSGASSQVSKPATEISSATHPRIDTQFAKQAAAGGIAEVKFGQLAEEKGTTQQVKDFGKRMVTDHGQADDKLKSTASAGNIALPEQMSAKDQAAYDRLSKLSGTAFDMAYARDMVRDHESDIAAFQHEANDGKLASIKDFASQTMPMLQEHLKLAQQMYNSVSAASRTQKTHKTA